MNQERFKIAKIKVTTELKLSHLEDLIRQERVIKAKITELRSLNEEDTDQAYFPFETDDDTNQFIVRDSHKDGGPYDTVDTAARLMANTLGCGFTYFYENQVLPGFFITGL